MLIERDRPVVVAIHPKLEFELKIRKQDLESATDKPIKGGITTYSKMAAFELEAIRKSGDEINKEILKLHTVPISKFKVDNKIQEFVPYNFYKKLFIFTSILKKKKDQQQINVDLTKLRGLKKNDVKIFW